MDRIRRFFRRHPLLRDAMLWAIPALIVGGVLRALMIRCMPYAVWGADSRSYFAFAHKLIHSGWFSMGDKRRFLYPILMVPTALLPGGALRWLPYIQHGLGLLALLPLAYVVRKTLVGWRLWIVPITVFYAGLPIVVYCEHELLGEHVFFITFIWAFAGWCAWVGETRMAQARRLFWWFFVPFALFILTKPAGRFVWPGVLVGLVAIGAWRILTFRDRRFAFSPQALLSRAQMASLVAVVVVTPFVGSMKQGAWLLYTAVFPLTRLDTPLHAEYKAQVADFVQRMRDNLDLYYHLQDDEPFYFLRDPGEQDARPLWKALGESKNEKLKNKIYLDLAKEGIFSRPDLFLYLAVERIVATGNVSSFYSDHFADGRCTEDFAKYYKEAVDDEGSPIRLALDLPKKGPIAPYDEFKKRLEPIPGSWESRALQAWVNAYNDRFDYFRFPAGAEREWKVNRVHITLWFWWLCLGSISSLLPAYRKTLGVWMVISVGYTFGVFLVSLVNARYFAPVWPVIFVLMAAPADAVFAHFLRRSAANKA